MRSLLAIVITLGACYSPSVESCLYACASDGTCPSGLSCTGGLCIAKGDVCSRIDGAALPVDAPPALPSFRNVDWDTPQLLQATVTTTSCQRRPVVTPNLGYLMFTQTTGTATMAGDCLTSGAVVVDLWGNGAPSTFTMPGHFAGEQFTLVENVFEGPRVGRGSDEVVIAYRGGSAGSTSSMYIPYRKDLSAAVGGAMPIVGIPANQQAAYTADGTRAVISDNNELSEGIGTLEGGYTFTPITGINSAMLEINPALSPDGLVLVFGRTQTVNPVSSTDLFVARRDTLDAPWEVTQLPHSPGAINTDSYEYEPFIAFNGDLVFVSTRASTFARQLFLARGSL